MNLSTYEEFQLSLGAAIEHAAENLPEGYSIDLSIKKNGYEVVLRTPDSGGWVHMEDCEGIVDEIEALVAYAVNEDKEYER